MPTTINFDTTEDGRPSAAHRWEQKFFTGGRPQRPPADELRKRIEQLESAIQKAKDEGREPQRGWAKELDWRKRQLQEA